MKKTSKGCCGLAPSDRAFDNFCSFQSAASELRQLWRENDVDQVQGDLAGQSSSGSSSHQSALDGCLLEAPIRTTKKSFQTLLDNEGLCTILFKIEAYHNARLLTLLEELRDCLILLKPFQLLTSRTYTNLPEVEDGDLNWRPPERRPRNWKSRWRYRQQLIAKWWRHCRSEYLAPCYRAENGRLTWWGPTGRTSPDTGRQRFLSTCPLRVMKELLPVSDGVA
ncbi:hypothetical protein T4B_10006 [Trichinella pseudospiralis]|nr:hypothetical protein T4B_10006 [Trichinella pseudospiralis]KRZ35796.1 hypothetical protein T4C_4295 [Trichinella pseudospiralis]